MLVQYCCDCVDMNISMMVHDYLLCMIIAPDCDRVIPLPPPHCLCVACQLVCKYTASIPQYLLLLPTVGREYVPLPPFFCPRPLTAEVVKCSWRVVRVDACGRSACSYQVVGMDAHADW